MDISKDFDQYHFRILDLGPSGRGFYDLLFDFISKTSDAGYETRWATNEIHKLVMVEIIRYLNLPPLEAMLLMRKVLKTSNIQDLLVLLRFREVDVLKGLCEDLSLPIYRHIRNQTQIGASYVFDRVGSDHVVVREYIPSIRRPIF